ncbi:50S ribosomal protein L31 [Treponema sp. R6D11]
MKDGIHPEYEKTTIKCACGNELQIGSTKKDVAVEICSNCHPMFTGKQKFVDKGGQIAKFQAKMKATSGSKKA